NGSDDPTGGITSQTTRGFTGEEELSVAGLVHLNGRVYDPLLARFTSADPSVTDPMNPQGWNRYSYVGNDPLVFTDPNGFSSLSHAFQAIGTFFGGIIKSVANFIKSNLQSLVQIAITAALSATGVFLPFVAIGLGAAITTGIFGGNLGQILKAGLIAGVTAFAFEQIGPVPAFASNPAQFLLRAGENAIVGCASAVASGGACGAGAAAAGVGAALSPITSQVFPRAQQDFEQRMGATLVQATVGGLASVAGGGKFANGAATAAFQYLATASLKDARGGADKNWMSANACLEDACIAEIAGGAAIANWLLGGATAGAVAYGVWKSWGWFGGDQVDD